MVCITLLSAMVDDIMVLESAKAIWHKAKKKYGSISLEKKRALVQIFGNFVKKPENNINAHLREMWQMITCLKAFGHTLTNEQQVHA